MTFLGALECHAPGNVDTDENSPTKPTDEEGHESLLMAEESHVEVVELVVELRINKVRFSALWVSALLTSLPPRPFM